MQNPQIFTVFGGSFISEQHATVSTSGKRSFGPVAAVVAALVLGTTISASAVAGFNRDQAAHPFAGSPFFSSHQLGIGFRTALW
jgi:hypothetical protein